MNYCNKIARIRNYNLRTSRKPYENSEEKIRTNKRKIQEWGNNGYFK